MTRTPSRFTRLLTIAALILGAGCNGDDNKIPGDQKANPVSPTFLFLDVRASRTTTTAGDLKHPVLITVQANFADTGAPVANGTKINLSTTLGSFDSPGGAATLVLEISGGLGTLNYFPPATGAGGTARIRAELQGLADSTQITVKPAPGEPPLPGEVRVATSVLLVPSPGVVAEDDGDGGADELVEFQATVRDQFGDLFSGGVVQFVTALGTWEDPPGDFVTSGSNGDASATLRLTEAEMETFSADILTVDVIASGATDSASVTILRPDAGPQPASVSLLVTPGTVIADDPAGEDFILLVIVRDQFAVLLPGAEVDFTTEMGVLGSGGSPITTDANGEAHETLHVTQAELLAFTGANFFTVTAASGGVTDTVFVTIDSSPTLFADFSYAVTSVNDVDFTDASFGGPLFWQWDFDNDGVIDSTDENPTNVNLALYGFTSPGSGEVKLTVSRDGTSDSITKSVFIP